MAVEAFKNAKLNDNIYRNNKVYVATNHSHNFIVLVQYSKFTSICGQYNWHAKSGGKEDYHVVKINDNNGMRCYILSHDISSKQRKGRLLWDESKHHKTKKGSSELI